ncbi:MAG: hypothetical protein INQ03_10880 [Candidatus Heimdallarchaeota archaeon]|nr:hypothetical protein [Candidatus Heimdallarchaeota archaeon]
MSDCILGIDLEIGSSPNAIREARYAAHVYSNNTDIILRNITLANIPEVIAEYDIKIIACDNIFEIAPNIDKIQLDLLNHIPLETQLLQVTRNQQKYYSLKFLLGLENIQYRGKLRSEITARYCAILASRGYGDKFHNGEWISAQKIIPVRMVSETNISLTQILPIASEVISSIGEGKEANIFLLHNKEGQAYIIKKFKIYSPVAKKLHKETYRSTPSTIATFMAKQEFKILGYLYSKGLPVPKPMFQQGSMVAMEVIVQDDDVAPRLSQLKIQD